MSEQPYWRMYAGTGISTDSARRKKAKTWARWIARQCKKLFQAKPMPELMFPVWEPRVKSRPQLTQFTVQTRPVSGADLDMPRGPKGLSQWFS
jgi:hypothetical protein